jgi:hypothetical protein
VSFGIREQVGGVRESPQFGKLVLIRWIGIPTPGCFADVYQRKEVVGAGVRMYVKLKGI